MPISPLLFLPYPPATGVTPNVPRDIKALVDRLEQAVPNYAIAAGSFSTSSATPADIPGASVSIDTTTLEILVFCAMSPSVSGDAKVNLLIDGVNYGQVAQVNAGSAGATPRWAFPGSTIGHPVGGGWIAATVAGTARVIKLQGSSSAGTAFIVGSLTVRKFS